MRENYTLKVVARGFKPKLTSLTPKHLDLFFYFSHIDMSDSDVDACIKVFSFNFHTF